MYNKLPPQKRKKQHCTPPRTSSSTSPCPPSQLELAKYTCNNMLSICSDRISLWCLQTHTHTTNTHHTLWASLSGTFLQTLPELVTPLKGHSFISTQLSTNAVSTLRKFWVLVRLWKQHGAQACTWIWDASAPSKKTKKTLLSRFKQFWFYFCWHKQHSQLYKKLTLIWASTKNCLLADIFETYGVINPGNGWRKDVIN